MASMETCNIILLFLHANEQLKGEGEDGKEGRNEEFKL